MPKRQEKSSRGSVVSKKLKYDDVHTPKNSQEDQRKIGTTETQGNLKTSQKLAKKD